MTLYWRIYSFAIVIAIIHIYSPTAGNLCPLILESGRQQCEFVGVTEHDCLDAGCCWDDDARNTALRCFHRECAAGYFGWGCRFQCHCKNGEACDPQTGECTSGCDRGNWGTGCLLDDECTYNDEEGESYMGQKVQTSKGHICGSWTLQRAYPGKYFPDGNLTLADNNCRNPQPKDHKTWCYYKFSPARKWDYCDLQQCDCPRGRYGVNCEQECHCQDPTESCDQQTGHCISGCHSHWTGEGCQECSDGFFGFGCELPCQCADTTEVCNKVNGTCVSACREGYNGPGCQIQLPRLTLPPMKVSRDAHSVTIRWARWRRSRDIGTGPVDGYFVYYRAIGEESWTKLRVGSTRLNIGALLEHTGYTITIIPIHRDGYVGYTGPELNVSTCGAPSTGPNNLHLRTQNEEEQDAERRYTLLTLSWQQPSSSNCDRISYYKVYERMLSDSRFEFREQVDGRKLTISHIEIYANYSVGVTAVNNAGLESEMAVATYVGRSGPPENCQMVPLSTSVLHITWSPPIIPNSAIQQYEIRYKEMRISDCDVEQTGWSERIIVMPHLLSVNLSELHPYSRYQMRMWVQTDAGRGQLATAFGTTLAIAPSVVLADVHLNQVLRRSAIFTWEPPECEDRYGQLLGYEYEIFDANTQVQVQQQVVNETTADVVHLVPYTQYSFTVRVLNHVGRGPPSAPISFKTLQDVPPAPESVIVRETTSSSMLVAWTPPNPTNGKLVGFSLQYWRMDRTQDPAIVELSPTLLQYNITRQPANTTFGIKVRASTEVDWGAWTRPILGYTKEALPSRPEHLQNVSRTSDTLTLRWRPPMQPNGVLLKYKVSCSPMSMIAQFATSVSQRPAEAETIVDADVHQATVAGLLPGAMYACAIKASTARGYGEAVRGVFWTLPSVSASPAAPQIDKTKTTDNSLTVYLPTTKNPSYQAFSESPDQEKVYQVVIESSSPVGRVKRAASTPCGLPQASLTNYDEAAARGMNCYIAAELTDVQEETFVVGDNRTYGGYKNPALDTGKEYNVWFGIVLTVDGTTAASYTKTDSSIVVAQYVAPEGSTSSGSSTALAGAAVAAVVIIIVLIVILLFLIVRRKRQYRNDRSIITQGSDEMETAERPVRSTELDDGARVGFLPGHSKESIQKEDSEEEPLCFSSSTENLHKPVSIENLWNYVREMKTSQSGGFKQEYEDLPAGLQFKAEAARLPDNKYKNRYGNIVAYDHSRVMLDFNDIEEETDYINANFIDGYRKPNMFIATQGPNKQTLNDIWKMAWQQNSTRIVMVTNLVEDGRHKCEQYWPDGEPKTYGDISVSLVSTEQLADYTIRTFATSKGEDTKTIRQYHFTAWPDHGVPTYATSLLAFRKKFRSHDDPTSGPAIVHCSAGVGRTGTFVALDYLLDQAKVEGQIDIYSCVLNMRRKRVNMIQTQEQYIFLHDALLEALKSGDTAIPCVDFRKVYLDICKPEPDTGKKKIEEEFDLMCIMSPVADSSTCKDALEQENAEKNRCKEIIPLDNLSRPYLVTYIPGATDYINAVFVDGYKQKDAFIVTQMPLPDTIMDFWTMVYDHKCRTIIMMNELNAKDENCACYWPEEGGTQEHGPFSVEMVAIDPSHPDVIIRDFTLTYTKKGGDPLFVRQFQYLGWPGDMTVPPQTSSVLSLLSLVERWQQRSGNSLITAHCMDGATQSGLFCAATHMLERLKLEQEVDIFQSAKHVKLNRPQLIPSLAQYQFLYEVAIAYMDSFETYSNFK